MSRKLRTSFVIDSGSLMDATNWRVLKVLQQDARVSMAELGRRVGLSAPAVAERVRRLEDAPGGRRNH